MATLAQMDPTRTTSLRRQFIAELTRRFKLVAQRVRALVAEEDAFNLQPVQASGILNKRFAFETAPGKLSKFREWLREQIDQGILEGDPTTGYINSAYKRGVVRSYVETKKAGGAISKTREAFLTDAFNGPVAVDRLELLYTRAFENLRGITEDMSAQLNRILADGFAAGRHPNLIARQMVQSIEGLTRVRARRLARTEVIHAYAEGSLDGYEALGIEELEVDVEWSTAGDDRVCPMCAAMSNTVMKLSEARGLIPRHPNCRCAWLPHLEGKYNRKKVRKAIDDSLRAESRKAFKQLKATGFGAGVANVHNITCSRSPSDRSRRSRGLVYNWSNGSLHRRDRRVKCRRTTTT